jgi:hypothetical protein
MDMLAQRYRAAFEKTEGGREQWIEGTLELGRVINEAQNTPELRDSRAYNRWLSTNQLEHLSPNNRRATVAIYQMERDHPGTGRKLLENNVGLCLRTIWEKKTPKVASGPLSKKDRGPLSWRSGSSRRKRAAARIPDVMREDYLPPRHMLPAADIKALTREQVDPDFKGTPLEFTTKYGHVTLHTKQEIEHNKKQDTLAAWLGAMADCDRADRSMLATLAGVDPETMKEWLAKSGRTDKLKAWIKQVELACEALRNIIGDR